MRNKIGFSKQIMLILLSLSIICTSLVGIIGYTITNKLNSSLVMNSVNILTDSTYDLIDSVVRTSIRNYLRAIAENNKQIVAKYYTKYQEGELSEEQARRAAEETLLSQSVRDTGYIYVVDSQGILKIHPELKGADLSAYDFIKEQIALKQGYVEYSWKNPSDSNSRAKALYMTYFQPWDYIISVTSYRDEFIKLVNTLDFKNNILSIKICESGYMYIMNSTGKLIIHPKLEGESIYNSVDSKGNYFIREIIHNKNGRIIYPWKNPGETKTREKIVIYKYYAPMDWFICSGVYIDELVKPIDLMKRKLVLTTLIILVFASIICLLYSKVLIRPIKQLIFAAENIANGNFNVQITNNRQDEIGRLITIFNNMVHKIRQVMADLQTTNKELEESNDSLEEKVRDRTKQLEQLSNLDGLTGIANRRRLDGYLQHEWDLAIRQTIPLSLIIADIDYFKKYNDTYGHPMGDECLKKVAGALCEALYRETDFCSRYGGEEFVAVLSNTGTTGAFEIAERIRMAILDLGIPHKSSPISDYVTVSLGVGTLLHFKDTNLNDFIELTDKALYAAKDGGRNTTNCITY